MKKGILTIWLLLMSASLSLAAVTNTSGPWGVDASGFLSLPIALTSTNTAGKNVVVSKSTTIGNITTDRAIVINPNVTITISPGSSSVVFNGPVTGGKFIIPDGVTVAFNGGFDPGVSGELSRHFYCSGTGKVTFDATKTSACCPEWWGLVANNNNPGVADTNITSINTSLVACRVTELQYADYFVSSKIAMLLPYRTLRGKGPYYDSTSNDVTRIISTSATATIAQIGPDTQPAAVGSPPSEINALHKGNVFENIMLSRNIAPSVAGAVGLKNQYTLNAAITRARSDGSIYGYEFLDTVQTRVFESVATRTIAGTGGTDLWRGFYVNGLGTPLAGLNSGNASTYLDHCTATADRSVVANTSGFYFDGGFTDLFVESPETTGTAIGINIQGNGSTDPTKNMTDVDLQIHMPIVDNFGTAGILYNAVNKYGVIEVVGGYYGGGVGATSGMSFTNSYGAMNIIGGQIHCGGSVSGGVSVMKGINFDTGQGVNISGTVINDCIEGGMDISNVTNSVFTPVIRNQTQVMTGASIRALNTTSRNMYAPRIYGAASSMEYGVQMVGTGHTYNEINASGIDPVVFAAGSGRKVNINGVSITTTGLTGNNSISGVMN